MAKRVNEATVRIVIEVEKLNSELHGWIIIKGMFSSGFSLIVHVLLGGKKEALILIQAKFVTLYPRGVMAGQ